MAKEVHDEEVIRFIESLPAAALARTAPRGPEWFYATVDCGPDSYVSDAVPILGGRTHEEACESVKRWLIADSRDENWTGKIQCAPRWSAYDLLYRLGNYWREKATLLDNTARPELALPGVWREVQATRFVKENADGSALVEAALAGQFVHLYAKKKEPPGGLMRRFLQVGFERVEVTDAAAIASAVRSLEARARF